jgi:hypothetical protein
MERKRVLSLFKGIPSFRNEVEERAKPAKKHARRSERVKNIERTGASRYTLLTGARRIFFVFMADTSCRVDFGLQREYNIFRARCQGVRENSIRN